MANGPTTKAPGRYESTVAGAPIRSCPINAPSRRDDATFLQWFGRLERASASPGAILALMRANYDIDVRHVLSVIQAPVTHEMNGIRGSRNSILLTTSRNCSAAESSSAE